MTGHASHKGTSPKPNTNAEGSLDTVTDGINPHEIAPDNAETMRVQESPENEAATEQPDNISEQ
ncbi:hypothetical protein cce_3600 [Crocosphaera subtropica ATCC 51142]|uniref:Uncharacterized protein n=1 Tax=Crocosphaera subtropica (strain ATCC 51142 / BH68) TaxID=43989 RepID=B1X0Q9_CROS5|nr:hypothetical protein [Crocosphaera subtropica]ACB52948.1 hypothetical protein cce_3600 [Crocosphaera subtropica ATCC 51142]